jgi:hypothetical protein
LSFNRIPIICKHFKKTAATYAALFTSKPLLMMKANNRFPVPDRYFSKRFGKVAPTAVLRRKGIIMQRGVNIKFKERLKFSLSFGRKTPLSPMIPTG